ncbi:DUF4785 domain-containing protein [Legionella maioricensis]|uniref:DUF4785 family protein n=1 Tax=Legionella maioricensis TaxID=2896528 RepID=A0A9X2CX79_9GAMM|nr:DUF4785 domain-containing protein [Legionella maioricensis]MCL9682494.1 DUF4785 family protein [Legionella maioricensis]MCL9686259.1 DUF4785 family protein [Legionella maioricensis]
MKTTHLVLMSAFCFSQTHAYTLPSQPTKAYDCDVCTKLSHEKLQDKWSISDVPLDKKVTNIQKSFGYKERVTAKQLQAGVSISTLAPGAVIRITPLQKKAMPQLLFKTPTNKLMNLKEASSLYSENETSGDEFFATKYQTMLQIKPELGAGKFIIKSKTIGEKNSDAYLINVLDKFSLLYLQVESDSIHYQYGDKLISTITLKDNDADYSIDDIDLALIGPQGQVNPLKLTRLKRNKFEAITTLDSELNDHGENWYIEANIETDIGQTRIKRSGHTAFSYSIPSASLLTLKKTSSHPLTFTATMDVATASRYALQSVLFYKDSNGEIKPIETSQKAQWFESGQQVIQFTFDNLSQLSDDSLYLGYLRLLDYGQLKTVYQYNQPIKVTQLLE